MPQTKKSGLGKLARFARVMFFIFLAITLSFLAFYFLKGFIIESIKQAAEEAEATESEEALNDMIISGEFFDILLWVVIGFAAATGLFLLLWVIGSNRIKEENQKEIETNRRIHLSKKKIAKPLLLIFGGLAVLMGYAFFLIVLSQYNVEVAGSAEAAQEMGQFDNISDAFQSSPTNIFLFACIAIAALGLIFFIVGLKIKTRRHRSSRDIKRTHDGDKLIITFNKLTENNFIDVYQDTVNDGYTEFVSFDGKEFVFRTRFSQSELQAQYNLREKFFGAKGRKKERVRAMMPPYFSEQPTIHYENRRVKDGDPYQVKVPHYKRVQVGTEWTEVTYSDGTKRKENEHAVYKDVLDYYTLDTIQDMISQYLYYHNEDNSPLVNAEGSQLIIYFTYSDTIDSVRI